MATAKRVPTAQRRYSLDEVDRMRRAIRRISPPVCYYQSISYPGTLLPATTEDGTEETLRTYMMAGVSADELEAKADRVLKERDEANFKQREVEVRLKQNKSLRRVFGYGK